MENMVYFLLFLHEKKKRNCKSAILLQSTSEICKKRKENEAMQKLKDCWLLVLRL